MTTQPTTSLTKFIRTEGRDEDGNVVPLALAVSAPTARTKENARLNRARAWARAVEAGAMIRAQLDTYLRKANLWDEERQAAYDRLTRVVLDGELRLARGGIRKSEARKVALEMGRARTGIQSLLVARNEIDRETAEAIADQEQFNYLVAHSTVYNEGRREGQPYFTRDGQHAALDDYLERGTEKAARDAAEAMSELLYGGLDEALAKLPENQFLAKYGFVDAKLRLVDGDGHLIDEDGRRIDEDSYYVDADGHRVDRSGNRVDADGNYVVEFTEFLNDDDDNDARAPDPSPEQPEPEPEPEPDPDPEQEASESGPDAE